MEVIITNIQECFRTTSLINRSGYEPINGQTDPPLSKIWIAVTLLCLVIIFAGLVLLVLGYDPLATGMLFSVPTSCCFYWLVKYLYWNGYFGCLKRICCFFRPDGVETPEMQPSPFLETHSFPGPPSPQSIPGPSIPSQSLLGPPTLAQLFPEPPTLPQSFKKSPTLPHSIPGPASMPKSLLKSPLQLLSVPESQAPLNSVPRPPTPLNPLPGPASEPDLLPEAPSLPNSFQELIILGLTI